MAYVHCKPIPLKFFSGGVLTLDRWLFTGRGVPIRDPNLPQSSRTPPGLPDWPNPNPNRRK